MDDAKLAKWRRYLPAKLLYGNLLYYLNRSAFDHHVAGFLRSELDAYIKATPINPERFTRITIALRRIAYRFFDFLAEAKNLKQDLRLKQSLVSTTYFKEDCATEPCSLIDSFGTETFVYISIPKNASSSLEAMWQLSLEQTFDFSEAALYGHRLYINLVEFPRLVDEFFMGFLAPMPITTKPPPQL